MTATAVTSFRETSGTTPYLQGLRTWHIASGAVCAQVRARTRYRTAEVASGSDRITHVRRLLRSFSRGSSGADLVTQFGESPRTTVGDVRDAAACVGMHARTAALPACATHPRQAAAGTPRRGRRRRLPGGARVGRARARIPYRQLGSGRGPDAGRVRRSARGLALPPALEHARLARPGGTAARGRHDRFGRARAHGARATRGRAARRARRGLGRSRDPAGGPRLHGEALALAAADHRAAPAAGRVVRALRPPPRHERGRGAHALRAGAARLACRARTRRSRGSVTSDAIERLARSADWSERARAARLIARGKPGDKEEIVLRLLRDPGSAAVSETMVAALLEARREGAIRLILRSLGHDGEASQETGQTLLDGLLSRELDGIEVRASIVSVLQDSDDPDELVGALRAIAWLAPSGGFPAPPEALAHVR